MARTRKPKNDYLELNEFVRILQGTISAALRLKDYPAEEENIDKYYRPAALELVTTMNNLIEGETMTLQEAGIILLTAAWLVYSTEDMNAGN